MIALWNRFWALPWPVKALLALGVLAAVWYVSGAAAGLLALIGSSLWAGRQAKEAAKRDELRQQADTAREDAAKARGGAEALGARTRDRAGEIERANERVRQADAEAARREADYADSEARRGVDTRTPEQLRDDIRAKLRSRTGPPADR